MSGGNLRQPRFGMYGDVHAFHSKFGQMVSNTPQHITRALLRERVCFMLEELHEFAEGAGLKWTPMEGIRFAENEDQDLSMQADALVDLIYVALGTAVMLGLPWDELWKDVHAANMRKELRPVAHRMTFQQPANMIGKPTNWVPPRTEEILHQAGYEPHRFLDEDGAHVVDKNCRGV